jgi:CBS domain containing-hemolysin-like protein
MNEWTIIIISLAFSAFFSGIEIAFISSNRLKIEVDKNKGSFTARMLSKFYQIPSKFIGAFLIGNNVALVIYGIAISKILAQPVHRIMPEYLGNEALFLIVQSIIASMLILIVAEFLPKVLFRINPNQVLNVFAFPTAIIFYLFYPFIYLYISVSEFVIKIFTQIRPTHENPVVNVIDLDQYIKEFSPENQKQDEIQQEIQMFQNAIDFRSIKLRECMVPRTEIVALEINDSIANLRNAFINSGHSKIPVYTGSIDNIVGYTHSTDLFKNPTSVKSILRPIIVVPETMLANVALSMFIQQNRSIAVVVDEFGGTSGIITMEDVIEEIFGEINDEFDTEDLTERQISNHEFIFSARLEIDYINENYSLVLPESEEYETLAGLIIYYHQSIPDINDRIKMGSFVFVILEATETRIEKVKLIIDRPSDV